MLELLLLEDVPDAERAAFEAGIAGLAMLPGQEAFVSGPERLLRAAAADPDRKLFAIQYQGEVVGTGTLHRGGGAAALGWPGDWVLLRGLLIAAPGQGRGYGSAAAAAAVVLAGQLFPQAEGVVLGVNIANPAGQRAYAKAGYTVVGEYLEPRNGPQLVMAQRFSSTKVDDWPAVN
ncbi:MAG: GNAT family N-acetyltransferase [Renibacterium sp.]|nr:GNAT family N-acetyltransferase [Renibacterium sp.]